MLKHPRLTLLILSIGCMPGQIPDPHALLKHALHLADLYNWADAAPDFVKAEEKFLAAGDERNALYAKLGKIRSNIEREQRALPTMSAYLAGELDSNPLLQSDKP